MRVLQSLSRLTKIITRLRLRSIYFKQLRCWNEWLDFVREEQRLRLQLPKYSGEVVLKDGEVRQYRFPNISFCFILIIKITTLEILLTYNLCYNVDSPISFPPSPPRSSIQSRRLLDAFFFLKNRELLVRIFSTWVGILDGIYRRRHFRGIISLRNSQRFGATIIGRWLQHTRWKKSGIIFAVADCSKPKCLANSHYKISSHPCQLVDLCKMFFTILLTCCVCWHFICICELCFYLQSYQRVNGSICSYANTTSNGCIEHLKSGPGGYFSKSL
jgi:hypothetical protein